MGIISTLLVIIPAVLIILLIVYATFRVALKKRLDMISQPLESVQSYAKVKQLMGSVKSVEDEIARYRCTYNIVQEFNTITDVVPSSIVASMFRFTKLDYLEFEEEISKSPGLKWQI